MSLLPIYLSSTSVFVLNSLFQVNQLYSRVKFSGTLSLEQWTKNHKETKEVSQAAIEQEEFHWEQPEKASVTRIF